MCIKVYILEFIKDVGRSGVLIRRTAGGFPWFGDQRVST